MQELYTTETLSLMYETENKVDLDWMNVFNTNLSKRFPYSGVTTITFLS